MSSSLRSLEDWPIGDRILWMLNVTKLGGSCQIYANGIHVHAHDEDGECHETLVTTARRAAEVLADLMEWSDVPRH